MAYKCVVRDDLQIGVVTLSGVVTGDTFLKALEALYGAADWVPGYNTIWDYRSVAELVVAPDEADQILARLSDFSSAIGGGRAVAVASLCITCLPTCSARAVPPRNVPSKRFTTWRQPSSG